jgi:hypothetical protein
MFETAARDTLPPSPQKRPATAGIESRDFPRVISDLTAQFQKVELTKRERFGCTKLAKISSSRT